ncbi:MAG: hypothetical protein ACOYD9_01820 [Pyramidobacter sp.]
MSNTDLKNTGVYGIFFPSGGNFFIKKSTRPSPSGGGLVLLIWGERAQKLEDDRFLTAF